MAGGGGVGAGGPFAYIRYIPIYFVRNSCTPRIYFTK